MAWKTDETGTQAGIGWPPCRPGRHTDRLELAMELTTHAGEGQAGMQTGMGRLPCRQVPRAARRRGRHEPAGEPPSAPRRPAPRPAWAGWDAGGSTERTGIGAGIGRPGGRLALREIRHVARHGPAPMPARDQQPFLAHFFVFDRDHHEDVL